MATAHAIRRATASTPTLAPTPASLAVVAISPADRRSWADAVWASDLTSTDKLVALAYADHAGDGTGHVFVSGERLRAWTSLGKTATTSALRRLEAGGWLVVTGRARQHYSTRYALVIPHDAGVARPVDEAGPGVHETVSAVREADSWDGSAVREAAPAVRLAAPAVREADPIPDHNHDHNQQGAQGERELIEKICDRAPGLAAGLSAATLTHHADALAAAGWTPTALGTALIGVDFARARGAGLLRTVLADLAVQGPPRPRLVAATTTCPVHETTSTGPCPGCAGDHRAGEHAPDADGPSTACHLCATITASTRNAA